MQNDSPKGIIAAIVVILILSWFVALMVPSDGGAEEFTEMYVTANLLNGRATSSKKGNKEALFDRGDKVQATGEWSNDYHWIEIIGGETGTVWCDIRYLTERKGTFTVKNLKKTPVKIRKFPFKGKITGYLKNGKSVVIEQVVLGWGRCEQGWIDLFYVDEE